jgi:BolA protein
MFCMHDTAASPSRAARLETALQRVFSPVVLTVTDDSARHAGHAGARPDGETHYTVLIVSEAFRGQGRIARHRMVNVAVVGEFASGLHALALVLRTPEEHAVNG